MESSKDDVSQEVEDYCIRDQPIGSFEMYVYLSRVAFESNLIASSAGNAGYRIMQNTAENAACVLNAITAINDFSSKDIAPVGLDLETKTKLFKRQFFTLMRVALEVLRKSKPDLYDTSKAILESERIIFLENKQIDLSYLARFTIGLITQRPVVVIATDVAIPGVKFSCLFPETTVLNSDSMFIEYVHNVDGGHFSRILDVLGLMREINKAFTDQDSSEFKLYDINTTGPTISEMGQMKWNQSKMTLDQILSFRKVDVFEVQYTVTSDDEDESPSIDTKSDEAILRGSGFANQIPGVKEFETFKKVLNENKVKFGITKITFDSNVVLERERLCTFSFNHDRKKLIGFVVRSSADVGILARYFLRILIYCLGEKADLRDKIVRHLIALNDGYKIVENTQLPNISELGIAQRQQSVFELIHYYFPEIEVVGQNLHIRRVNLDLNQQRLSFEAAATILIYTALTCCSITQPPPKTVLNKTERKANSAKNVKVTVDQLPYIDGTQIEGLFKFKSDVAYEKLSPEAKTLYLIKNLLTEIATQTTDKGYENNISYWLPRPYSGASTPSIQAISYTDNPGNEIEREASDGEIPVVRSGFADTISVPPTAVGTDSELTNLDTSAVSMVSDASFETTTSYYDKVDDTNKAKDDLKRYIKRMWPSNVRTVPFFDLQLDTRPTQRPFQQALYAHHRGEKWELPKDIINRDYKGLLDVADVELDETSLNLEEQFEQQQRLELFRALRFALGGPNPHELLNRVGIPYPATSVVIRNKGYLTVDYTVYALLVIGLISRGKTDLGPLEFLTSAMFVAKLEETLKVGFIFDGKDGNEYVYLSKEYLDDRNPSLEKLFEIMRSRVDKTSSGSKDPLYDIFGADEFQRECYILSVALYGFALSQNGYFKVDITILFIDEINKSIQNLESILGEDGIQKLLETPGFLTYNKLSSEDAIKRIQTEINEPSLLKYKFPLERHQIGGFSASVRSLISAFSTLKYNQTDFMMDSPSNPVVSKYIAQFALVFYDDEFMYGSDNLDSDEEGDVSSLPQLSETDETSFEILEESTSSPKRLGEAKPLSDPSVDETVQPGELIEEGTRLGNSSMVEITVPPVVVEELSLPPGIVSTNKNPEPAEVLSDVDDEDDGFGTLRIDTSKVVDDTKATATIAQVEATPTKTAQPSVITTIVFTPPPVLPDDKPEIKLATPSIFQDANGKPLHGTLKWACSLTAEKYIRRYPGQENYRRLVLENGKAFIAKDNTVEWCEQYVHSHDAFVDGFFGYPFVGLKKGEKWALEEALALQLDHEEPDSFELIALMKNWFELPKKKRASATKAKSPL